MSKQNYKKGQKDQKKSGNKGQYRDGKQRKNMSEEPYVGDASRSDNDVSWYAPNDMILRDVASLPFSHVVGQKYRVGLNSYGNDKTASVESTIPGIMRLEYLPTYGASDDPTSTINVAAQNINTFVRHMNSGSKTYEPTDLMMFLAAMDGIYSFYWECVRAYGVARYYLWSNRYLAQTMLETLGFNANSIITDLAGFRTLIHTMAMKLNTKFVPNTMTLFDRRRFLNSNVFMDAPSVKAQLYAFVPIATVKLIEMSGDQSEGSIDYNMRVYKDAEHPDDDMDMPTINIAGCRNLFNDMFNAIDTSEAFATMSGDILKAYGANRCRKLDLMPEDYQVVPVYNEEVLPQIHNFRGVGFPVADDNNRHRCIIQEPKHGILRTTCTVWGPNPAQSAFSSAELLDLRSPSPTPADVMIATRFMPALHSVVSLSEENPEDNEFIGTVRWKYDVASEIGVRACVVSFKGNGLPDYDYYQTLFNMGVEAEHSGESYGIDTYRSTYEYRVRQLSKYSQFDWSPLLFPIEFDQLVDDNNAVAYTMRPVLADLDTYTVVSSETLAAMNSVAMLQMFGIPYTGFTS